MKREFILSKVALLFGDVFVLFSFLRFDKLLFLH